MTDAREIVQAILARCEAPEWVDAELAGKSADQRQAACKRVAHWLLRLLGADHPEYEP